VEAMLATADVTGDSVWLERAARIGAFVVEQARGNGWRIPEHFDASWNPIPDYNDDHRDDPFKPYGATVGHALEWSRLLLNLEAADLGSVQGAADWSGAAQAGYPDAAVAFAADQADIRKATPVLQKQLQLSSTRNW